MATVVIGREPAAEEATSAAPAAAAAAVGPGELSEEQLRALRAQIHESLLRHDVYGQVRHILSQTCVDPTTGSFGAPTSPSDVLEVLRQRGVVQQIAASVAVPTSGASHTAGAARGASSALHVNRVTSVDVRAALQTRGAQRLLLVRLLGGRAFIDNIVPDNEVRVHGGSPDAASASSSSSSSSSSTMMVVHVHFGAHRFRSQPRAPDVDPDFDDEFLAEINPPPGRELSELDVPMRIMVTREAPFMARSTFVGENVVDWRRVLRTGSLSVAVELASAPGGGGGVGAGLGGSGVPAGLLELQLELLPDARAHSDEELQLRAAQEKSATVAADREMLLYARRWWAEYHAMSPRFAQRKVKVFAVSASGGRALPVTHFVHRIAPDRSLEGPDDAARFVSLLQLERPDEHARGAEFLIGCVGAGAAAGGSVGGGALSSSSSSGDAAAAWCDMFRLLATRRGDRASHSALLCSLFLGMGLDAYCAIGESAAEPGVAALAVITRRPRVGGAGAVGFATTVWDPVAGTHSEVAAPSRGPDFPSPSSSSSPSSLAAAVPCLSTIGCVFNATDFFANIQHDDATALADFDLDDDRKWLRMNPVKLHVVPRPVAAPPLWLALDARALERDMESRLQRCIATHRERADLATVFDAQLGACFAQVLARSEMRRRGVACGMELFEQCVRGFVQGQTFKGLPLCMPHLDAAKVVAAALQVPVGKTIVDCPFDGAVLAVRVRVSVFPEGVVACWVMLGVRYRTLEIE
jgi:centrosomal protein CEP76